MGADDVRFALVRSLEGLTSGNFDHTKSGWGETPKACLELMCENTALDDGRDPHANMCWGVSDGTNERQTLGSSANNHTAPYHWTHNMNDGHVLYLNRPEDASGGRDGWALFDSFISNGVRINVDNTFDADSALVSFLIAGGANLKVQVGSFVPNLTQNNTTVVTTNFQIDFVLFSHAYWGFTTLHGSSGSNHTSWGMCTYDGSTIRQCAQGFFGRHNAGANDLSGAVYNNRCMLDQDSDTGGTLNTSVEITAVSSTTFTATTRDGGGVNYPVCYLAVGLPDGINATCGVIDSHTTENQNKTYTSTDLPGLDFTPQAVIAISSMLSAVNTVKIDAEAGGYGYGVALGTGADEEFCVSCCVKDTGTTSDAENGSHARVVHQPNHIGTMDTTNGYQATHVSFGSGEFTWNYPTNGVDSTARKICVLAIEEEAAAGGGLATTLMANAIMAPFYKRQDSGLWLPNQSLSIPRGRRMRQWRDVRRKQRWL